MKELFNSIKLGSLRRSTAWLLAVIMLIGCINPASLVFAKDSNSGAWNVEYSLGLEDDGSIELADDEGVIYTKVDEGQMAFFTMQLRVDEKGNSKRFQDAFHVVMPSYLYDALVEENGEPETWFDCDFVDNGQLLELKELMNFDSSNKRVNKHSTSNSTASGSDWDYDMIDLKFQFTEELRKNTDPATVEIGTESYTLGFEVPESTILLCVQDGYDCEIIDASNMAATTGFDLTQNDSMWDCTWSITINDVTVSDISNVKIKKDDVIGFRFDIKIKEEFKNNGTARYDSEFSFEVPKALYDIIKNDPNLEIAQPEWVSSYPDETDPDCKDVFADMKITEGSKTVKITVPFHDRFIQEDNESPNVEDAFYQFSFRAAENATIITIVTEQGDDDSIQIEYTKDEEKDVRLEGSKNVAAVFKNDGTVQTKAPFGVVKGEYVLYRIAVTAKDFSVATPSYAIKPGDLYDVYDKTVYKYFDLNETSNKSTIDAWISSLPSYSEIERGLKGTDNSTATRSNAWNHITTLPPAAGVNTNLNAYENQDRVVLTEENSVAYFYICLEVISENASKEQLNNKAYIYHDDQFIGGDDDGPSSKLYQDVAITLAPTTIMRKDASGPVRAASDSKLGIDDYRYPISADNDNLKLADGDYVTFRLRCYDQGTEASKIKKVSFYLPIGLELVTSTWAAQRPEYKFAVNTTSGNPDKPLTLENNHLFEENLTVGTPASISGQPFSDYYQVIPYTYELPNPIMAELEPSFFITCRVTGVDQMLNGTRTDKTLAAQYGYLISAEINEILNAKTNLTAEDEDSFIDDLPLNDWYNHKTDQLKDSTLYLDGNNGEVDYRTSAHVRSKDQHYYSNNAYNDKYANYDEDDFDFSLIFPFEKLTESDDKGILKSVMKESDGLTKTIEDLLEQTGQENDYTIISGGKLTKTKTIIPYIVTINRDGSRLMNQVTFTDELPETMSFLMIPGTNQAIVGINERIENNGFRYPAEVPSGSVIKIDESFVQTAKRYLNPAYVGVAPANIPGTVAANSNQWNTEVSPVPNSSKTKLTIDFGDIGDNSYEIIYFAIVEKVDLQYENSAKITWETVTEEKVTDEDNAIVKEWDTSAGGRGHGKSISRSADSGFEVGGSLQLTPAECENGVRLYYKLDLTQKGYNHPKKDIMRRDYIMPLKLGNTTIEPDVKIINIINHANDSGKRFTADYDPLSSYVRIQNVDDIDKEDNVNISVIVEVFYSQVPYGSVITNTFSDTTTVTAPLRLDLSKVDGNNDTKGLDGAEFDLIYANDGDPVLTEGTKGTPVSFDTDGDGNASASFYLNSKKKASGSNCYYLEMRETKEPEGYYKLGDKNGDRNQPYVIEFEVVDNTDGTYEFNPIGQNEDYSLLSTGRLGQIQITAKNYRDDKPFILDLEMVKKLLHVDTGAGLPLESYEFTMELSKGNAANVKINSINAFSNTTNGTIKFSGIEIKDEGDYEFVIKEKIPSDSGNTIYDEGTITASVSVRWGTNGKLQQVGSTVYEKSVKQGDEKFLDKDKEGTTFINFQKPDEDKKYITIYKISASAGGGALSGAEFELYRQPDGDDIDENAWVKVDITLTTSGSNGSVMIPLPDDYMEYQYRLIETKAPDGYSKSRVGEIVFKVTEDGTIDTWKHDGTPGYVAVNDNKTAFTIKNHTSGGNTPGGNTPGGNTPGGNTPGTPGGPGGGSGSGTTINDGSTPLGKLTEFIEDTIIPLTGLVKTGDYSVPILLLGLAMIVSAGGFVIVTYRKKKQKQ